MRKTSIAVAIVSLVVLSGCHREHSSPTALPSANSVLTGRVVMTGDLAGSSPAGITVSSSGQVATTDAGGNFTFIGINSVGGGMVFAESNNLQFSFTRNSDGISAQGSVAPNAASVTVNLQKHSATMVSTGQQKHELEGKITKISDSSITVNDASSGGDVTAAINSSTVIRSGNQTLTTKDLSVGDQVHVKATVESDRSLTAFEIMKQNSGTGDGSGGQTQELEGPITAVSSSSITVHNASTGTDVTAKITSSTVIRHGNTTIKASDLKAGQQVHVKTTGSGDSLTATEILVQN